MQSKRALYRRFLVLLLAPTLASYAAGSPASAAPAFEFGAPAPDSIKAPLKRLDFKILKLHCASCANSYATLLSLTPGVKYVKVELFPNRDACATVIYISGQTSRSGILERLHQFHFQEAEVKEK